MKYLMGMILLAVIALAASKIFFSKNFTLEKPVTVANGTVLPKKQPPVKSLEVTNIVDSASISISTKKVKFEDKLFLKTEEEINKNGVVKIELELNPKNIIHLSQEMYIYEHEDRLGSAFTVQYSGGEQDTVLINGDEYLKEFSSNGLFYLVVKKNLNWQDNKNVELSLYSLKTGLLGKATIDYIGFEGAGEFIVTNKGEVYEHNTSPDIVLDEVILRKIIFDHDYEPEVILHDISAKGEESRKQIKYFEEAELFMLFHKYINPRTRKIETQIDVIKSDREFLFSQVLPVGVLPLTNFRRYLSSDDYLVDTYNDFLGVSVVCVNQSVNSTKFYSRGIVGIFKSKKKIIFTQSKQSLKSGQPNYLSSIKNKEKKQWRIFFSTGELMKLSYQNFNLIADFDALPDRDYCAVVGINMNEAIYFQRNGTISRYIWDKKGLTVSKRGLILDEIRRAQFYKLEDKIILHPYNSRETLYSIN